MSNKKTWESMTVVQNYTLGSELQKPEETILAAFKDSFKDMKMLDIGVGGGRTTIHFAPLAKEYVGIDYSQGMIEACNARFSDHAKNVSFEVCDARSMSVFTDNQFDFVLFSFNGIDYVSLRERIRILEEVRRVGRKGGYFLFSTHNLNADIEKSLSIQLPGSLKRFISQLARYLLFHVLNWHLVNARRNAEYLIINDGAHWFRLKTFYIRPAEQVKQLKALGFAEVKVLTLDGQQRDTESEYTMAKDPWLYYLCRITKD